MANTRLLQVCETAGIASWHPTTPGDYYSNAWVENWAGDGYALVKFPDLAEIPNNATILQARLRWKMYDSDNPSHEREGTGTLTIRANRITADWIPSSVTWNTRPSFDSTNAPSITDAFNQPGQWTPWWDVTAHVAGIVAGTYPNYGWLMEMTNYGGGVAFQNYGYAAELEVTYVAPAAATTESPTGTQNNPATITDRVSGFDLIASFESEGNEPIDSITAQIYEVDGNQAWEYSEIYNVLSGNQQSVEVDASGFSAIGGATIARDTTRAWHGSASLKITPAASVGSGTRISFAAPVIGQEYSARCMVSGPFGKKLEMQLQATDASGVVLNAGAVQRTLLGNTSLTGCSQTEAKSWTEFAVEDVIAVAGSMEMRIEVTTTDTSAPVFYLDGNILTPDVEVAHWVSRGEVHFSIPPNILEYGKLYSWRVKADNSAGSSGWSPLAYFMCVLSPVTGLSAVGVPDEALIRLLWDAHPGENLAGYRVYRAVAGEQLTLHSIDLVGAETFDDNVAQTGIAYDYQVAAVASNGYEGPQSNVVNSMVNFKGFWLNELNIKLKELPQLEHPRLQSNRIALDGSLVTQDYGFGPRNLSLSIFYMSKAEKDIILGMLSNSTIFAYRDSLGEVFRGRIDGDIDEKRLGDPRRDIGIFTIRLREVKPND